MKQAEQIKRTFQQAIEPILASNKTHRDNAKLLTRDNKLNESRENT
jgi:hypothetical protein